MEYLANENVTPVITCARDATELLPCKEVQVRATLSHISVICLTCKCHG